MSLLFSSVCQSLRDIVLDRRNRVTPQCDDNIVNKTEFFFVLGAVVGAGKIASYLSSKVWQVAFKSFSLTTSQPYSWLSRQRVTHSDNFPICFSSDENFCGSAAVAVKADADLAARSSLAITMLSHVVQCCTKLNNAIVCYTMMYKTKQCYSMLYNAI